jgi:dihydroorotate dehydrogenase electron transfer subunit
MFDKYCQEVEVSTEVAIEGFWHGNVITPIDNCSYSSIPNWFSCGPLPMQKALTEYAQAHDITNLQVSLEARMGCGFGTCVGCTVSLKSLSDNGTIGKKVCKDGPVFNGNEVVW